MSAGQLAPVSSDRFADRKASGAPAPVGVRQGVAPGGGAAFAAFIFLTGVLFLRPGDIFPELQSLRIYGFGCILCLLLMHDRVLAQLRPSMLKRRPLTICVLAIMVSAIISQIAHGEFYDARVVAAECLVSALYYLFLVGIVDSPARLRKYLLWLSFFIVVLTSLGMLQYFDVIDVNARPYTEVQDYDNPDSGQPVTLARLCAIGIYNNPNDLARIVVIGTLLCMYFAGDARQKQARYFWGGCVALLMYALGMTYSRGGFLALLAGLSTWFYLRFGRTRSIIVAAIVLPMLFILFAGRITDIDTSEGTGQDRIQLWRDAFEQMKTSPIFGIGVGNLSDQIGLLAHNSFVQYFAETGLFGGTIFAGTFYLVIWAPLRLKRYVPAVPDPEMRRLRAFLIAIMVGVVVGMFSSTRNLKLETYMLLGIVAAYLHIFEIYVPRSSLKFDWPVFRRLVAAGIIGLIFFNVYVRIAAR